MPLPLLLTALAALSAVLAIVADQRGARRGVYVFKPLATTLILAVALAAPAVVLPRYQALVCAGLLFSLAGDVFLMLPRDRFVAGLASFLVAHGMYIAAFAPRPPPVMGRMPWMAYVGPVALAVLLGYGIVLMRALWPRLGRLRAPVAVYAAALLAMAWLAVDRWGEYGGDTGFMAAVGALLFVASDSALAWQRFVRKWRYGQVVVLGTYWMAQWLIAASVYWPTFPG